MAITWSDEGFTGIAPLWRDQINTSRQFRRINRATGDTEDWDPDDLPQVEIPNDDEPIFVTASLDVPSQLISWALSAVESNAALDAGHMWWVQSGRRVGVLNTVQQ